MSSSPVPASEPAAAGDGDDASREAEPEPPRTEMVWNPLLMHTDRLSKSFEEVARWCERVREQIAAPLPEFPAEFLAVVDLCPEYASRARAARKKMHSMAERIEKLKKTVDVVQHRKNQKETREAERWAAVSK